MAGDFIPHQDGAFLEWAKTLVAYVSPNLTAFNIPQETLTPIQGQLTAYETAFEAAQNPNRGKVDVLNKNETKEALIQSLRAFIKAYLTYNVPAVYDGLAAQIRALRSKGKMWRRFCVGMSVANDLPKP
jgi:hypothetical protein